MVCKHLFIFVLLSISSSISLAQETVPDEINKLYSYQLTGSNYENIIAGIQANKKQFRDTTAVYKGTAEMFSLSDISSFTAISSNIRIVTLIVNKIPEFRNGDVEDSLLLMSLSIFLKDSLTSKEANFVLKTFRKKIRAYYPNEWISYHPTTKTRIVLYHNSKFGTRNPPFRLMMDKSLTGRYRILLTYTVILYKN